MLKIQDNNSIIKYSARINLITKDNLGYIASQRLKKTLIINKSSLENLILKLETLIGIQVYFFFKIRQSINFKRKNLSMIYKYN